MLDEMAAGATKKKKAKLCGHNFANS